MVQLRARELTINSASPVTGHNLSPATISPSHNSHHLPDVEPAPVILAAASDSADSGAAQLTSKDRRSSSISKAVTRTPLVSPFHDCLDQFGKFTRLEFRRPNDGYVNGYVKFRWANKASQQSDGSQPVPDPVDAGPWTDLPTTMPNAVAGPTPGGLVPVISLHSPVTTEFPTTDVTGFSPAKSEWSSFTSAASSPDLLPQDGSGMVVQPTNPRMLPPQFGFRAKMETSTDRRFWEFCELRFCCLTLYILYGDC